MRWAAKKDETHAPAVQWSTIRLLLTLTCICKLQASQMDFGNAFAQADLPEPVHMLVPRDFHVNASVKQHPDQEMCLKLRKNLHGLVDAPQLWCEMLRDGMLKRGFTRSSNDPCLFHHDKVIAVCCVDDVLWFSEEEQDIRDVLQSFTNDGDERKWEHTIEGSVHAFSGIDVEELGDGGWKLTRSGLINNILETAKMMECSSKPTPTSSAGPL